MTGQRKKIVHWVMTKSGMRLKVWVNRSTGTVLPTNWKIQAGFLAERSAPRTAR